MKKGGGPVDRVGWQSDSDGETRIKVLCPLIHNSQGGEVSAVRLTIIY